MAADEYEHVERSVEVEHFAPDLVIVSLRGEHDLADRQALAETLARAGEGRNLLVDLSDCTFLDSTVLGLLLATSLEREAEGARLGLVIPPEAEIVFRITRVAGVSSFMPIYASREAGIAELRVQ